jgi:hypothetical protein
MSQNRKPSARVTWVPVVQTLDVCQAVEKKMTEMPSVLRVHEGQGERKERQDAAQSSMRNRCGTKKVAAEAQDE